MKVAKTEIRGGSVRYEVLLGCVYVEDVGGKSIYRVESDLYPYVACCASYGYPKSVADINTQCADRYETLEAARSALGR